MKQYLYILIQVRELTYEKWHVIILSISFWVITAFSHCLLLPKCHPVVKNWFQHTDYHHSGPLTGLIQEKVPLILLDGEDKFTLGQVMITYRDNRDITEHYIKPHCYEPTWCHLLVYFTYYALNMFRTLIYPSSGTCDCVDELPHRWSCSQFVVCWSFWCGRFLVVFVSQAEACKTQRTENKTTDVVIHQHSRRLLKMDISMSETYWAHNKWNKLASGIMLVFHSSTHADRLLYKPWTNKWTEIPQYE